MNVLDKNKLSSELSDCSIVREIRHFDSLSSTNTYARELIQNGGNDGTLIIAEQQPRGRGRMNRKWFSPPGLGIWMSLIIEPPAVTHPFALVNFCSSLAVLDALEWRLQKSGELKWPNDVLFSRRKICGIMSEGFRNKNGTLFIVLGIGINVNHHLEDFPDELQVTATSLFIERGFNFNREVLVGDTLMRLQNYFTSSDAIGFEGILTQWVKRCTTLGKKVRVRHSNTDIYGVAENVLSSGLLSVRTGDMRTVTVSAGDVFYIEEEPVL